MRKNRNSLRGSSLGFTLIELLVVIAIIAILATLLMPTLGKAKDLAKNAACMSNQKQLSIWVKMYLDDNNDQFFLHYTGSEFPLFWWSKLHFQYEEDGLGNYDDKVRVSYAQNVSKVFSCPAAVRPDYGWGNNDWLNTKDVSYGMQHDFLAGAKYSDVYKPSETLVLADIETRPVGYWLLFRPSWRLMDGTSYINDWGGASWHSGGLNVLWADLHVSSMDEADLYNDGKDKYFDLE